MLNLTSDQRRAVLITIIIILIAAVIQWVQPHIYVPRTLDYSESDSIFFRLSAQNHYQYTEHHTSEKYAVKKSPKKEAQLKHKSIDLNNAEKNDLEKLPRIGPKTAQLILDYRKSNGKFKSNKELMEIKGIGPKTFKKIEPYLKEIKSK
jgi:comEA protein